VFWISGRHAGLLVSNSESRGDRKFHVTLSPCAIPSASRRASRRSRSYLTQSHTHKTQEKVLCGKRLLRDASSPKRRYLQPDSEIEMKKAPKSLLNADFKVGRTTQAGSQLPWYLHHGMGRSQACGFSHRSRAVSSNFGLRLDRLSY
jgi:hypothetical protein